MDHQEARQLGAVEKYLLNELHPPQRAQFEEHFFDCRDCAADLRMTAEFLSIARKELGRGTPTATAPSRQERSWRELLLRPVVIAPAFALLLAVIVYQNAVVLPRFGAEILRLGRPGVVSTVSLIGGNSRAGAPRTVTGSASQPLLLSLDIPATQEYPSYACVLMDSSGAVVWQVPVSAKQAQDTVSISVPAGNLRVGDYMLVVQGLEPRDPRDGGRTRATELARYRFALIPSD